MKGKIFGSFALCLMLAISAVSAITIDNVEISRDKNSYNHKVDTVKLVYDVEYNEECSRLGQSVRILDHKDNIVGYRHDKIPCKYWFFGRIWYAGTPSYTGTMSKVLYVGLDEKNDIKGNGNLRYEFFDTKNPETVLASGSLKWFAKSEVNEFFIFVIIIKFK